MNDVRRGPHSASEQEESRLPSREQRAQQRTVAVVTSFLPEPSLIEHCALLAEQVHTIIVVDDGSGAAADAVLDQLSANGVRVERQPENAGIANAINRGYEVAAEYAPEFLVTFDQDSKVVPGFIASLVETYDEAVMQGLNPGMIAPELFAGMLQTQMPQKRGLLEAYQPIQSGLLMPFAVVQHLGPQRGDFFIDSVDTEYYQRAVREGYDCLCAEGLNMPHSLGHMLHVRVFGRFLARRDGTRRSISVSSPFRYYYRVRNRIVLNREYLKTSPRKSEMLRDTINEAMHYGFAWYCARGKWSFIRVLGAGLGAGRRSEMGKIPQAVAETSRKISWKHRVTHAENRP